MSAHAQAPQADDWLPPREVVELAHHLVAGPGRRLRLVAHEPLRESVHRLRFEGRTGLVSVIAKCLSARIARANELVARRWLPAVGLESACPRLRGVVPERSTAKVWHIYEDIAGSELDGSLPDRSRLVPVVELIVDLHTRFASHALLPECRSRGGELGIGFFAAHVARSIDALGSIGSLGPPLPGEQAELRDRLLGRVERLCAEQNPRASLLEKHGGPDTLLHGDLWPINMLVTRQAGGYRATLIDWDRVGVGPVTYDLSTLLYQFAPSYRPWILERYREAAARRGWQLPDDSTLNLLFETAECARYASCLGEAALAASRGESWGFQMLAEIDSWFANLEPALTTDGGL